MSQMEFGIIAECGCSELQSIELWHVAAFEQWWSDVARVVSVEHVSDLLFGPLLACFTDLWAYSTLRHSPYNWFQ